MKTQILKIGAAGIGLMLTALTPAVALADTSTTTRRAVCEASAGLAVGQHASTTAQVIAVGNCMIAVRDTSLDAKIAKINANVKIATTTRAAIVARLQATETQLASIKTALGANTTFEDARDDYRTIMTNVRVYGLQIPRANVQARQSVVATAITRLQGIQSTLASENNALASSTVKATNALLLADMTTQMNAASVSAQNAVNLVANLSPDMGSTTVKASNKAAVDSARNSIKAARTALTNAMHDAHQVRVNIKAAN